jgi:hypothetical protein
MYARFNEAFDASVHADDIDTAKVRFVGMTASFYEAFAASARADGIAEAKISQMRVDMILYTRDCQDAPLSSMPSRIRRPAFTRPSPPARAPSAWTS